MTTKISEDLIQAKAELLSAGIALQGQGLVRLLAEMEALKGLMVGAALPPQDLTEAETEASFDNMPV